MRKERLRKVVCTTLVVMVAVLGLVTIAMAQEEGIPADGMILKKGPHVPTANRVQPQPNSSLAPPANDECAGAVSIPDGPYPVCSPITTGILDATDTGDPRVTGSCSGNFNSRNSVWYTWTPSVTAFYKILDCPGGNCGAGTTLTEPGDGILHVYTSAADCDGTYALAACNDDGCGGVGVQSSIVGNFIGGQKYWILVGYWTDNVPGDETPFDQAQVRIEFLPPPPNDTCGTAQPLLLNTLTRGSINPLAANNYQLTSTTCYLNGSQQGNGVCSGGPTPGAPCTVTANCGAGGACSLSAMAGRDVVYSFTAPAAGTYTFRVTHYDGGTNNTLLVAGACDGTFPGVPSCLRAVNRNVPLTGGPFGAEEVKCLALAAGQTVFPVVDNTATSNSAVSSFEIQVTHCVDELEFNNSPANAENPAGDGSLPPNSISRGCPVEGTAFQGVPGGDIDFFTLDAPPAGTRLFVQLDANSAPPNSGSTGNGVNFDMRVTNLTDTLEFDDANNNSEFGGFSPSISGRELPGGPAYLRVSMATTTAFAEPYRLYTTLRAPGSGPLGTSAQAEPGPDDDSAFPVGDYFYGNVDDRQAFCAGHPEIPCTAASDCPDVADGEFCADTFDSDFYGFCARAGEQIFVAVDADPQRDNTPLYTGFFLFRPSGTRVYGLADSIAQGTTSNNTPSPGTLTGTTPFSPSNNINYLADETGLWAVAVNGQDPSGTGIGLLSSGDYLVSLATQCSAQEADLSITKTGDVAGVAGGNVNYTITVNNSGPGMGTAAFFHDTTPAGTTFVGITIPDGWDCITPMAGDAGDIDCFELSGCFDGSAVFELTLNVSQCAGTGDITNTVEVFGSTADPDTDNNTASATTAIVDPGTCDDGDACTENDACNGTVCEGTTIDCDDNNACTDDACVDGACVSTPNTGSCDDGNACTTGDVCADGTCQPGTPNNDPCDDGNACTSNDTCSGGVCQGGSSVNCDDGNVCTDDSCVSGVGCVNTCNNTCNTKGQGYWKRLCHGPHSGDFYTDADVDCVNNACTFSDVDSISELCDELNPTPANDKCEKAEAKFAALLLNVCRCRVQAGQSLDSSCGPGSTVAAAVANSDATLCNPGRTDAECNHADCATFEIINGQALWANSLRIARQGTSVRLTWEPPYAQPDTLTGGGPKKYHVWRRAAGSIAPFVQIGVVNPNQALTFLDTNAATGNWTYEVTSEY